jgi:exosortase A-associated hydrolase 2
MSGGRFEIEPFFLEANGRRLFALHLYPDAPPQGAVLYLHPFAEEMHKSRRMAALQARRFVAQGLAVLQIDLTGCGDSEGDFADATWERWREDALAAYAWLHQRWNGPTRLWGLRLGATLAAEVASLAEPGPAGLLLWQPVLQGAQFLTQFLRIRLGSDMLASGRAQTGVDALRAQLLAGEIVEVGGYGLAPNLAAGLEQLRLAAFTPPCPVTWIEMAAAPDRPFPPGAARMAQTWRDAGLEVHTRIAAGANFWVTQEITESRELLEASDTWR